MALLPPAAPHTLPRVIEEMKTCIKDPNTGGRTKRDRLAAVALNFGGEASNKPWVGHVLALLCESLEAGTVNEIMAQGHGRYKKEWDKWELGVGPRPAWQKKRGEDTIRNLVYDLLMNDLIVLYNGYKVDGGPPVKPLSVKGVCKKVKDEIGIVIIKDSYLREKFESRGVTRNLRGERNPQSLDSPSPLGGPTPPSLDIPSTYLRQNPTSGLLSSSLNATPRRPTPIYHAHGSGGISCQSNTTAITQRPNLPQPFKGPGHYFHSRSNNSSSTKAVQNSRDVTRALRIPKDLAPTPMPGEEMFIGTHDGLHNDQLMSSSSGDIYSCNGNLGDLSRSFAPTQTEGWPSMLEKLDDSQEKRLGFNPTSSVGHISNADDPYNDHDVSSSLPLILTTEAQTPGPQSNQGLNQLSEQIKLLTNRFDTELLARDSLRDEVVKWQNLYNNLSSGYDHLIQKSQDLEGLCKSLNESNISEQSKREQMEDEMENLRQKYKGLNAAVQRLSSANEELQSAVRILQSSNRTKAEHIDALQSSLTQSKNENSNLRTNLNLFQHHNHELIAHNDSLSTEVIKLTELFEKCKFEETAKGLQQKDNLQHTVDRLQAENDRLHSQVAELQEAKDILSERVGVLERECASFQEASEAPDINPTQKFQGHLSNWTTDSAMGESMRASISSRKRQISITDEQEEKRQKSLHFVGEEGGTFLTDADPEPGPEGLRIMAISEFPFRSGWEAPTHAAGEGIPGDFPHLNHNDGGFM